MHEVGGAFAVSLAVDSQRSGDQKYRVVLSARSEDVSVPGVAGPPNVAPGLDPRSKKNAGIVRGHACSSLPASIYSSIPPSSFPANLLFSGLPCDSQSGQPQRCPSIGDELISSLQGAPFHEVTPLLLLPLLSNLPPDHPPTGRIPRGRGPARQARMRSDASGGR
jgi:hypothetical protein